MRLHCLALFAFRAAGWERVIKACIVVGLTIPNPLPTGARGLIGVGHAIADITLPLIAADKASPYPPYKYAQVTQLHLTRLVPGVRFSDRQAALDSLCRTQRLFARFVYFYFFF